MSAENETTTTTTLAPAVRGESFPLEVDLGRCLNGTTEYGFLPCEEEPFECLAENGCIDAGPIIKEDVPSPPVTTVAVVAHQPQPVQELPATGVEHAFALTIATGMVMVGSWMTKLARR